MVMSQMLRFAVITAIGALAAAGAARALINYDPGPAREAPLRGPQTSDPAAQPAPEAASLSKAPDGHFWAEGAVNGQRVRFLVDTGASSVALTSNDAQRLGFDLAGLDYDIPVRTANGESRAARVKLNSVSVAGARMANVDALVVKHGLQVSLLGMSYLGRLSRFEASQNVLILRP
jgi:aspartyl protease family protein